MTPAIRVLAFVLMGVLAGSAACAETVAETAARWGLIGVWRLDCSVPLSTSAPRLMFVVKNGQLFHDRDFGDRQDSSQVQSVTIKPDGSLDLVVRFTVLSQTRQFAFIKGGPDRKRAWYNRNVDTDEYTVVDGKFTANGNPTPWQFHCR